MNIPEPPLSPDVLDELLSADLDGEFERAAADLGFDPQAARAAMDATPDVATRRVALERARALLATPPPFDPERMDAFVAAAVDAVEAPGAPVPLRARRSTRAWQAVAGIAAAAAVVVGIVAVAGTNTGSNSTSKSLSADREAAADSATTVPAATRRTRTAIAFGDVSQPGALESRVRNLLPASERAPAVVPQATSGSGRVTLEPSESNSYATDAAAKRAARHGIQGCTGVLRRQAAIGSAPLLSGSGTVGAVPVYVVVFDDASGRVAFALAASDCSVVTRVPVP